MYWRHSSFYRKEGFRKDRDSGEMRFFRAFYPFFLYSGGNAKDRKSRNGRGERYPWSVAFNFPEITFLHYFLRLLLPRRWVVTCTRHESCAYVRYVSTDIYMSLIHIRKLRKLSMYLHDVHTKLHITSHTPAYICIYPTICICCRFWNIF